MKIDSYKNHTIKKAMNKLKEIAAKKEEKEEGSLDVAHLAEMLHKRKEAKSVEEEIE